MNAHGSVDEFVPIGKPDSGFQIRRSFARADRHHGFDAGRPRPRDGFVAVGIELTIVQMAVGIDKLDACVHFNRAPTGMSSRNPASTGLPPSTEAATIMPLEVRPRNFRGCRLATITTLRWMSCSGL